MSATPEPASETEQTPGDIANLPKKIAFRFCHECSNLLYPKEDRINDKLIFKCQTCLQEYPAHSSCVYRNEVGTSVGDTAGITQDVAVDPTLPRSNKQCPTCGGKEAVFFQSQQRTSETGMRLYYVCCKCGHVWQ